MSRFRILFISAMAAWAMAPAPLAAQNKKDQIAALQAKADSLSTELLRSRERAQDDERARSALLHRLDTLQQGRARDAAYHLQREQRLQQDLDGANSALQQARDELAALQQQQATAMTSDPYHWYVPLKKEIVDAVPDEEAANNVLGVVDHLINDHCMRLKSMEAAGEEGGWHGEEDIGISLTHHSQQFLLLRINTYGFYGGAHDASSDYMLAFRKASGAQVPLEALLLPERKAQLAAALQKKVRALNDEVNACLKHDNEEGGYDLTDWSPSEGETSMITIYKDGVSFDFDLLSYAERACEPGIVFDKREVAPFFVRGVWD
jgi:hypothetical protein